MSEKTEQTKKKLAQNADKITIGVLGVILLALGWMWFQEQNSGLGTAESSGRDAVFQDNLADSPTLRMLQNMNAAPNIANNPSAQRLVDHNMFDNSTMQLEDQTEKQALQQVAAAEQLIKDNRPEEARPLLERAVEVARYNQQAVQLLDSITTPTTPAVDPNADPNAVPADGMM